MTTKSTKSVEQRALIMVAPLKDTAISALQLEIEKAVAYAEKVEVIDGAAYKSVTIDLTLLRGLKKMVKHHQSEYTDPINAHLAEVRGEFNSLLEPLDTADKLIAGKMLAYNQEQERIRREQEDINRKRQEAAEQEMKLKGELTEPVGLVEVTEGPAKSVHTDVGTSSMKDNWTWEVIDFSLVPDEYKIINPAILTPAAKSYKDTRTIPGIKIINKPIIAVRAK